MATLLHLSSESALLNSPPPMRGAARHTGLLTCKIRHLRGFTKEQARGAKVRLRVEGKTYDTAGSWYKEPRNTLRPTEGELGPDDQLPDPAAQRLCELLAARHSSVAASSPPVSSSPQTHA